MKTSTYLPIEDLYPGGRREGLVQAYSWGGAPFFAIPASEFSTKKKDRSTYVLAFQPRGLEHLAVWAEEVALSREGMWEMLRTLSDLWDQEATAVEAQSRLPFLPFPEGPDVEWYWFQDLMEARAADALCGPPPKGRQTEAAKRSLDPAQLRQKLEELAKSKGLR